VPETRAAHVDAVGGLAGDMLAAALADAFPDLVAAVLGDVEAVVPRDIAESVIARTVRDHIAASTFRVMARENAGRPEADYPAFRKRLAEAPLAAATRDLALDTLRRLAEAEAAIHAVPVEQVHFHEIADWDTLVDVTAVASFATRAGISSWTCSSLPRGDGTIMTAHGRLPVPGPATLRLLGGFSWHDDGVPGERVTPTGAALLAALVSVPGARAPGGTLRAVGYGAGTRRLAGVPNIVRVSVHAREAAAESDIVTIITFDIDDMTGEEIAVASDRLRAMDGVLDVLLMPALGKKGRPVTVFRLLARPERRDAIVSACFTETSTIGLRHHEERRAVLARRIVSGEVPIKRVIRPGGNETAKAESDSLATTPGLAARRERASRAENVSAAPDLAHARSTPPRDAAK
jgi:uncharacterized protein (TIGR00299 family) protein